MERMRLWMALGEFETIAKHWKHSISDGNGQEWKI